MDSILFIPTASVHQGAAGVDHPRLEGVREGPISVKAAHDDHDQTKDYPEHNQNKVQDC